MLREQIETCPGVPGSIMEGIREEVMPGLQLEEKQNGPGKIHQAVRIAYKKPEREKNALSHANDEVWCHLQGSVCAR